MMITFLTQFSNNIDYLNLNLKKMEFQKLLYFQAIYFQKVFLIATCIQTFYHSKFLYHQSINYSYNFTKIKLKTSLDFKFTLIILLKIIHHHFLFFIIKEKLNLVKSHLFPLKYH